MSNQENLSPTIDGETGDLPNKVDSEVMQINRISHVLQSNGEFVVQDSSPEQIRDKSS